MHRPNFATRFMALMTGLLAGTRFDGDTLKVGAKTHKHGPSSPFGGAANAAYGPRVAFTAKSGRTILRETVAGSGHERRLLARKDAHPVVPGFSRPDRARRRDLRARRTT